ncbi:hypothetical protein J6590_059211 [Homalodisca vitripennis]|nr:hypothetical protein J6590_059211 [Homalodisca vitripennis]
MSNNKDTLTESTAGLTFRCAGSGVAGGLESGSFGPLGGVLLIGDSMLKYSGRGCALAGAEVDVNPGARIHNIKEKLIRYNGGWGKRAVLHTMADLLNVARHSFPNSLIMLSGVLLRNDISALAIANFNEQLALMCNNFGCVKSLTSVGCLEAIDSTRVLLLLSLRWSLLSRLQGQRDRLSGRKTRTMAIDAHTVSTRQYPFYKHGL